MGHEKIHDKASNLIIPVLANQRHVFPMRSEERRVGKECER